MEADIVRASYPTIDEVSRWRSIGFDLFLGRHAPSEVVPRYRCALDKYTFVAVPQVFASRGDGVPVVYHREVLKTSQHADGILYFEAGVRANIGRTSPNEIQGFRWTGSSVHIAV